MKDKSTLLAVVAILAAGPALANDMPVPSFNDMPELYSHSADKGTPTGASQGPSRPASAPAPMNGGPWLVNPSSGA